MSKIAVFLKRTVAIFYILTHLCLLVSTRLVGRKGVVGVVGGAAVQKFASVSKSTETLNKQALQISCELLRQIELDGTASIAW